MAGVLRGFVDRLRGRDPSSRIQDAARRHAMRDASDSDACAGVRADITDVPHAQLLREIAAWHPRGDYVNDRAYRLLVGVRDGGVVPPMEPERQANFSREQELGRLPLPEAYSRLAATTPALTDMERRARGGERPTPSELQHLLNETGLDPTRSPDRTEFRIITHYLRSCAQGRVDPTPLFDRDPRFEAHGSIQAWPQ
jgi:hypothetical protein